MALDDSTTIVPINGEILSSSIVINKFEIKGNGWGEAVLVLHSEQYLKIGLHSVILILD